MSGASLGLCSLFPKSALEPVLKPGRVCRDPRAKSQRGTGKCPEECTPGAAPLPWQKGHLGLQVIAELPHPLSGCFVSGKC